jgi:CRISPR-associated protein Cmr2
MSWDYFVEIDKSQADPNWKAVDEVTTRYHRLISDQQKKKADQMRSQWSKQALNVTLSEPTGDAWQMIANPSSDLSPLPPCSFFLRFTFTLAKAYLSKDDRPFYIIDSPIVRDKVFQLPMVRSTSWKGNLYSALWQLGHDKQNDEQMGTLFGYIRSEESGQAGRLFFYPSFFTQTSLEIINPHDRKRRVGKNPILFESVPAGARSTFSLLYVPFDRIGQDESETRRQAAAHLRLAAEAVSAMMLTYSFSAKRTSGYGTAEDKIVEGEVRTKAGVHSLTGKKLSQLAQEVAHVSF